MPRHFLFCLPVISAMASHAFAQDAQKPAKLPVKVMAAWEKAEKVVQKNREIYDKANEKALAAFQKDLERMNPPVNVEEVVKQFQQEAIVALDANAKPPAPPPPDIGNGILVFNGHRYRLFVETLTWDEAKKRCEDLGGHLLSIETGQEQAFIHKAMLQFRTTRPDFPGNAMLWLGLVRDKATNKWVSMITGQPQLYSNWEPLQPKDGHPHSAMFVGHGRWHSSVDGPHFAVCEWDN